MNYRAACPHCASVFRLGDDQLAAAQGWVQCGVCGAAFDARLSLLMEDGSALPRVAIPAPRDAEPAAAEPTAETAPEQPQHAAASPAAESGAAQPEHTAPASATETPRGIRGREDALDLPSIILIDPNLPSYDEPGPLPAIRAESREITPPPAPVAPDERMPPAPPPAARVEYAQPVPSRVSAPAAHRRRKPWAWALAALLLLALAAQTAYFLRDTLVLRLPQARPAIEQACAWLGCTLSLPKRLDYLRIVGSDLASEADGRLRLDLTLGNHAVHAQAWPVLILTLTDPGGRPIARRSFAPSEYLGDPARIAAGMPPRSEQALRLPLAVTGIAPSGFELSLGY